MSEQYFEEEEFESRFNGRTITRVLQQATPHWPMLAGFLLATVVVALVDAVFTYLSKLIIDEAIVPGDEEALVRFLAIYGVLILVQAVGIFLFIYFTATLGERIRYDLRKRLFNHLQELSFSYFDRTPVGWIISRVTSDTERIAELVTWGMADMSWGIMSITISMIFMFLINWRLALVILLLLPVLVVVAFEFQKHILKEFRQVRRINSKITGAYNENISGVRVTKALAREQRDLVEFQDLSTDMYQASYRASWLSALFLPVVQLITALGVAATVLFGGLQVDNGMMTVGEIQAFIAYIMFMMWPVQEMSRVYAQMQQSIASAERVFSLLDAVPDIQDKEDAGTPNSIGGDILFEDVEFYYEEDKPVLADFNLHVEQGETIALVGPTGGGKSTIVNLLCRFYEPKNGRVLLNGADYTDLTQQAIQSRLGMVLQTPHLFSGTIRENLRYGRLEATDEEIEAAARLAGAHQFIMALEKGYDEDVGEGGGLLSVGLPSPTLTRPRL